MSVLSEEEWKEAFQTVIDWGAHDVPARTAIEEHDREQRAEIEKLKARLDCGHLRWESLTIGDHRRTDEGDCTICLLHEEIRRLEAEVTGKESLTVAYSRHRDAARVRDARAEAPKPDEPALFWDGDYWAPAWMHPARNGILVWADQDMGAGPVEKCPFWLPMPPAPEEPK